MDMAQKVLNKCWPQVTAVGWIPVPKDHRFSGARLWHVSAVDGDYCLRQWPSEADPDHLRGIHRLLRHATRQAIDFLPRPIAGVGGATLVHERSHWWELTNWLPGEATFARHPSEDKLKAAAGALACFHQAVVSFPGGVGSCCRSPGLQYRFARLEWLLSGGVAELRAHTAGDWIEFVSLAAAILQQVERIAAQVQQEVRPFVDRRWSLQLCLRDIWHPHVLFRGDRVTGIVDFGAVAWDHVATDLARLFGSMIEDDCGAWEMALDAYAAERPLAVIERQLVQVFDRANVVLSGIQWIEWIFVERRTFRDPQSVLDRCHHFLRRLDWLGQDLS